MTWANRQKTQELSAPQSAAMDSIYPGWRDTLDEKWLAKLAGVEAYVAANGSFPPASSKDPAVKLLGIWVGMQRSRADLLSEDRIRLLDERLPGWNRSTHQAWNERLEAAAAYFTLHGRLPSIHNPDKAVAAAARWVGTQRRAAESLSHRRQAALDARLPGWREKRDDKWEAMLDYVVAFEKNNGRLPGRSAVDAQENRASQWLQRQKMGSGMTPEREQRLDACVARWRETLEDAWFRRLREYESFYEANGRRPRADSADATERVLANWLNTAYASTLSPVRSAALASAGIGPGKRDEVWTSTQKAVVDFRAVHGRLPKKTGVEPGEQRLGEWLNTAKVARATLPSERREALTKSIPGWDQTFEDLWQQELELCIAFVTTQGRFPRSSRMSPADEQRLARWLFDARKAQGAKPRQRAEILDERLPGWRAARTKFPHT